MAEVKDLVVQIPLDVEKLSEKEYVTGLLQDVETQVKSYVFDVETPDGRASIKSLAFAVTKTKTHIVGVSDKDMESLNKRVKDRKGIIKYVVEFLDNLRDETREPLTKWETEQAIIAEEKLRKEAEKIDKRVADLLSVGFTMPRIDLATMTDEEYDTLLFDKTEEYKHDQARIVEEKRLEDERNAKEEAERKAENERLAKQKAEQDKIAADLKRQQDELAAKEKALQDEKERIAREEAIRVATYEAEIKRKEDAEAKSRQEAKEAEERELAAKQAEERRIALLPDKEKIQTWLMNIEIQWLDKYPADVSEEAAQFIAIVRDELASQILEYRQELEKF